LEKTPGRTSNNPIAAVGFILEQNAPTFHSKFTWVVPIRVISIHQIPEMKRPNKISSIVAQERRFRKY
jgi:hypothetical protein